LTLKWSFPTGAQITSSPTIVEGVCYVGSLDNNIYAINADTGNKIWAFTTGFQVASSVAVVNGKVYTGADDGNVYCLDAATGTQRWKTFAGGVTHSNLGYVEPPLRCSPIVVGNNVYVGALDGNLYCFDATTGNVRWSLQTPGPIFATPAYADNAVYLASSTDGVLFGASQHGDFYKLDANTGSIIWHIEIPYSNTNPPFGKFLMASPTVADDLIFLRNDFSYTYAINATTGEIVWTCTGTGNPLSSVQSIQEGGVAQLDAPLYKYGVVYVNNFYGISAINATDGSSTWFTYLSREDISQGISYSYGRIYVVTMLGVLYVLDANTGAKLSYHEFGYQLQSMPSLYNGYVYLGCNDWNVYCLGTPIDV
jgi:outer membrane protein assembly factor BamB